MATKTLFICQPYSQGSREELRPVPGFAYDNQPRALRWAEKNLGQGGIVGVHVVKQTVDDEMGDYSEPEIIAKLGQVPEIEALG